MTTVMTKIMKQKDLRLETLSEDWEWRCRCVGWTDDKTPQMSNIQSLFWHRRHTLCYSDGNTCYKTLKNDKNTRK